MLIGIISDSHDNFQGLREGRDLFSRRGVELALHAGDMISSGNCHIFEGSDIDLKLVYGNNDGDRVGLSRDFGHMGGEYLGDFGQVEVDGLRIALLHGTDEPVVRALVKCGHYDIVIRGHSHRAEVVRGDTLLINPGEVWGHLTGRRTVAILDTSSLEVEIVELGRCKSIREILKA
jgi:putative phosphoesterase